MTAERNVLTDGTSQPQTTGRDDFGAGLLGGAGVASSKSCVHKASVKKHVHIHSSPVRQEALACFHDGKWGLRKVK